MNPDEWHLDPKQDGIIRAGNIVMFDMTEADANPVMYKPGDSNTRKTHTTKHERKDLDEPSKFFKYFPGSTDDELIRTFDLSRLAESIEGANYPGTIAMNLAQKSIWYEEIEGITLLEYMNHASQFEHGTRFNREILRNLYEKIKTTEIPSIHESPEAVPYAYGEKIQKSLLRIFERFGFNPEDYKNEIDTVVAELNGQELSTRFTDRNPTNYLIDTKIFQEKRVKNPNIPLGIESVKTNDDLNLFVQAINESIRYTDQETLGYSVMSGTDEVHLIEKYPITRDNAPAAYLDEINELGLQRFFHHIRWADHNSGIKLENAFNELISTAIDHELLWSTYGILRRLGFYQNMESIGNLSQQETRNDILNSIMTNYNAHVMAPFTTPLVDLNHMSEQILADENISVNEKEIALNIMYRQGSNLYGAHTMLVEGDQRIIQLKDEVQSLYENNIDDMRIAYDAVNSIDNPALESFKNVFERIINSGMDLEAKIPQEVKSFIERCKLDIDGYIPRLHPGEFMPYFIELPNIFIPQYSQVESQAM